MFLMFYPKLIRSSLFESTLGFLLMYLILTSAFCIEQHPYFFVIIDYLIEALGKDTTFVFFIMKYTFWELIKETNF